MLKISIPRSLGLLLMLLGSVTTSQARGPIPSVNSSTLFTIYYGDDYYTNTSASIEDWILNQETIDALVEFEVVVMQPNQPHFTAEVVKALKDGGVDHVLGYISIGEDFINDAIESPLGGGTGMVAYDATAKDLLPLSGNTLQSFYVDVETQTVEYYASGRVKSVTVDETNGRLNPDGKPDYNPTFLGYMVNPDTNWRWVIGNMRIGTQDVFGRSTKAGLKQIAGLPEDTVSRDRSSNFGFDGFFLDTIDTAGPYANSGWYPWTVDEMRDTVKYISDTYPNQIVLANRGAFYYTAGLKSTLTEQYSIDYSIRPYVDAFLFESFRYDSDEANTGVSNYFNENRYNIAPKVMAEANRPDGFTVFGLEYQSGRTDAETTEDAFTHSVRELGFVGYMAEGRALDTIDTLFSDLLSNQASDTSAPTWDTTGNTNYNTATLNEERRIGVQSVSRVENSNDVIVQWDIANDRSLPVHYNIVITDITSGAIDLREHVSFEKSTGWDHNPAAISANQFTLSGLQPNRGYNIKVHAVDAVGNENTEDSGTSYFSAESLSNPVLRSSITIDGNLSDWAGLQPYSADADDVAGLSGSANAAGSGNQANWRQIQVAHSTDSNQLMMAYSNNTNIYISWGFQVFIDTDNDLSTGFSGSFAGIGSFPIGADYLIEGINVHQYNGDGTSWSWKAPVSGSFGVGRAWSGASGEVFLPLDWLGNPTDEFRFVVFGNNGFYDHPSEFDWYPDNAVNGGYFNYQF